MALDQVRKKGAKATIYVFDLLNPEDRKLLYLDMQTARIAAQHQPRKTKLPPLFPEFSGIGVFYIQRAEDIQTPLRSKLKHEVHDLTKSGGQTAVPQHSRFLRRTAHASPPTTTGESRVGEPCFEVAFGLPWTYESLIRRSAELGHPTNFCKIVLGDIED